jgi:hypothetical protein
MGGPVAGPVGGPVAGHPRSGGERRDRAPRAASPRSGGADIPPPHHHRHRRGALSAGSPATIALGATAIATPPATQRLPVEPPRPPRESGRPGLRPGLRLALRLVLRVAPRLALRVTLRPHAPHRRWRRRLPASPRADIPASSEGRATDPARRPAGSPAPIALGASTIASAPATRRLLSDHRRGACRRRDRVRVGARPAGHPGGHPAGRPAGHPGFGGERRDPAPRPASSRSARADIPATHQVRHRGSPAGFPATIALGATTIPSAPVRQRLLAEPPRPRLDRRGAGGTTSAVRRTVQVDGGTDGVTPAPDHGRRPMGGPLRPLVALFHMEGRSGRRMEGGAGAPPESASPAFMRRLSRRAGALQAPAAPGLLTAPPCGRGSGRPVRRRSGSQECRPRNCAIRVVSCFDPAGRVALSPQHTGTEFGPEAANPPRSCRNTAGRLRHRRYQLPCPSLKLSPARPLQGALAHDRIAPLAGRGVSR